MKAAQILLAAYPATADIFYSKGGKGKFYTVQEAQEYCEGQGAHIAGSHYDLSGKNGWYWMSEVFGDATVYKGVNAKTGKSKTAKQMKSGNKWAWAACSTSSDESSSTPAVRNCVPKGGLDNYSEHYKFYADEGVISRDQARSTCQQLGAGWDLAIISNKNEYNFIADSVDDNCWNHMAWWVGFNEYDTVSAGVSGRVETIFGKANEWELKWDVDSNFGVVQAEPNDQKGVEECVRMMERKLNDAICADGWTGVKKANVGMGFVCEKHNTIEYCQPGKVPDLSDTYKVVTGAGLDWDDSRAACQAVGNGWDLVVINDQDEHNIITEQMNCANNAFWVGHKESNGQMYDLDGNQVFMDNWDNHSNVLNPEANNQQGDEQCVRIRGDVMNDALCDRTWTGAERLNIPMGYICEYNAPVCKVDNKARPLQDDEYKIFPQNSPNTWSWNQGRQMCKDLGKHWDLAIFNYEREYTLINAILKENCVNDHAYWVGYNEDGGDATTVFGNAVSPGTNLGATTSIALPWDTDANEPNDNLGEEKCVRMNQFGTTNDAICSRTWTGGPKLEMGMGVICEKHNPCESQRGQPTVEYKDDRYYISTAQMISAEGAKAACQARGEFWDLAIIDDVKEHKLLNSKLGGCVPYWLGMTNPTGSKLIDHDGNDVLFAMWDTHLGHHVNPDEPNDQMGSETCVRMRGGMYNDALCNDSNGFNKKEMQGYICEYHYIPPPPPPPGPENCVECNHNTGTGYGQVAPWHTLGGCNKPMTCEAGARLEIVDAWKIGNGKNRPRRYGFVGKIKLPDDIDGSKDHFSVLIRFSKKVTHGHFQLWNMNFWNFYNGGYEVLIHSKQWNSDRQDKQSIAFIAEELDSDEYPELLFWRGKQTKHHCFQPSMHHGQQTHSGSALGVEANDPRARSGASNNSLTQYEAAIQMAPHVHADSVTSVKFKNGKIVKVRGRRN